MEVGLMDIVRSVNRSWIYDTWFSLYRAFHPGGKVRGGNIRGEMSGYQFSSIFLTHIFYLLISSSFTRMLTYSKFKYIINYCSSIDCDLPKYACHYMIINCIFLKKSAEQWNLRVTHENANTLLAITNLFSIMNSVY